MEADLNELKGFCKQQLDKEIKTLQESVAKQQSLQSQITSLELKLADATAQKDASIAELTREVKQQAQELHNEIEVQRDRMNEAFIEKKQEEDQLRVDVKTLSDKMANCIVQLEKSTGGDDELHKGLRLFASAFFSGSSKH